MTTSETGDPGFTLIELLLTLALIGLLSWLFVGGSTALFSDQGMTLDEQFWKACGAARREALEEQKSVLLSFDSKQRAFVLNDGSSTRQIHVSGSDELEIDFHPADTGSSSSVLIGGTLVDTETLAAPTFYSDGTCTPFRAQLRLKSGAHMLGVDPWTCAPVISNSDETQ